jgi:hypothetical protein
LQGAEEVSHMLRRQWVLGEVTKKSLLDGNFSEVSGYKD